MITNYYFRFRADKKVRVKELQYFLERVVTLQAGFHFSPIAFYKFNNGERVQQFGEPFEIEDERLIDVALPKASGIYAHDPVIGKVVLRPKAGLVLSFQRDNVVTSLGFLKFASTIRDVWGKVLGDFEFGHDWVFHDHLSPPDPRILELIGVFRQWGYLDVLDDADFDPEDAY